MKAVGIIPVRMASSRFPGKPLAKILGIPMVEHVYRRSLMAKSLDGVYVATCDQEIFDAVRAFGGKAVMTAESHERCTDRVSEAVGNLGLSADVVVNIQGDEPMVCPEHIDSVIKELEGDPSLVVVNLVVPIEDEAEHRNPNFVKVVMDREQFALYFSREPIPSRWKGNPPVSLFRQTGIIGFTWDFLRMFSTMEPTALEKVESVDMLRVIEHGYKVKLVAGGTPIYTVDTEGDRDWVEARMKEDQYLRVYLT